MDPKDESADTQFGFRKGKVTEMGCAFLHGITCICDFKEGKTLF